MTAFGQQTYDKPLSELYTDDKLFNFRLSLIDEEFTEIEAAIKNDDFVEFVDGIADLLVVTYGAGLAFGINLDDLVADYLSKENIERNDKTNYQMIREYMLKKNELVCNTTQPKLLNGAVKLVNKIYRPIEFEIDTIKNYEYHQNAMSYLNNHLNQYAYRLYNIILGTYKMGNTFGINVDEAFDIVHKSNMSKLCVSEEEAKETVEWYLKNEKRYPTPAYKQAADGIHWIVYEHSTGKVLKSINYTPADLRHFGL